MVECEFVTDVNWSEVYKVLIDTWWNVNSRQQLSYFPEQFVLIDTWWNVNF